MTRRPWLVLVLALVTSGLVGGAAPTPTASAAREEFVYGVTVDTTDARSMRLAREAGFTHAKMMLRWEAVEPSPGSYVWQGTKENDFDNIMKPARNEGIKLIVRVDGVPGWAGGSPANANLEAVRTFYEQVARYGADTVVGYEILNEPNLDREWGGPPDAAAYTAFMKAAARGIKAGSPSALVIGGGPAPGTGNNPGATIEDYDFLNGMYDAGARGLMDALGVHNYGGNTEPERDPATCGICFRRAELYRDLMVGRGDGNTPIWLTEWGYLMDPGQFLGQYDWMKVSADQQADYIVRAHRYADENWPWLQGSLLFNIDGATSPYQNYGDHDAKPWFSLLNADYSPRPAWHAFQDYRAGTVAQQARAAQPVQPAAEQPVAADPAPEGDGQERLRVVGTGGDGVNLRSAPSVSAGVIKTVPEGALLVASGGPRESEGRAWRNVREPGGASGWVAAEFVAPA